MVFSQNNVTSIIIEDKEYNIQSISFMGTEAEWNTNSDYIPKAGELVIYAPDEKNSSYRLKIGDGTKKIVELTLNYIETAAEREELLRIIENHTNRIESTAKDITDLKEEFREIKNSFDEVVVEKEEIQAVVEEHTNKIESITKDVVDLKEDFLDSKDNFNNDLSKKADIIQHASGEVITLDDAAYTPVKGLKLFGKTTQFTTTGKNLYSGGDVVVPKAWQGYQVINFPVDAEFPKFTLSFNPNGFVGNLVCLVQDAKTLVLSGTESRASLVITPQRSHSSNNLFYSNNEERSINFTDIQIELGNAATTYEPYTGGIPAPNPDYPQELVSVGASGAINTTVCGKNLWDARKNGSQYIGDWYVNTSSTNFSLSKATAECVCCRIPVLKGQKYVFSTSCTTLFLNVRFEDKNNNVVGGIDYRDLKNKPFSVTEQTVYIVVSIGFGNSTTYDYQLEHGATATEFEPYKEAQTLTAQTPNGLPGIPVSSGGNYTDEKGQQWICDEIDFARGVYVKRVALTAITTCDYFEKSANIAYCNLVYYPNRGKTFNVLSEKFINDRNGFNNRVAGTFTASTTNSGDWSDYMRAAFILPAGVATTRSEATAWLKEQGVAVLHPLYEPIETALSDEELTAYAALHTNKPNTTVYNDASAYMEMDYYTPLTAVQMVHSPADEGKVLSIDQHGCVILKKIASGDVEVDIEEITNIVLEETKKYTDDEISEWVGNKKVSEQISVAIDEIDYPVYAAEESVDASADTINADTLGGYHASDFAMAHDVENMTYTYEDVGAAQAGFGLGTEIESHPDGALFPPENDCNAVAGTGWCYIDANTKNNPIPYGGSLHSIRLSPDYIAQWISYIGHESTPTVQRVKRGGVWGEWEWVNSPMMAGVEYRTTERWNGKPVYAQIIGLGEMPNSSDKQINHNIANVEHIVEARGSSSRGYFFPLDWSEPSVGKVSLYVNPTSIIIECETDWTGYTCDVIMKYTKTTD